MRKLILAIAAVVTFGLAAPIATSATAEAQGYYGQQRGYHGHNHHGGWQSYNHYAPRAYFAPRRQHHWHHHHHRPRHHHHHRGW